MERSIDIVSIVNVDETCVVIIETVSVIEHVHVTQSIYTSVAVVNIYPTNLCHSPVEIIEDRYVLYLDHRTIIIILGEGTIIETGIKGYVVSSSRNHIVDVKVKLAIGIDRECDTFFHKNERVVISISIAFCNLSISYGGEGS